MNDMNQRIVLAQGFLIGIQRSLKIHEGALGD